MLFIKRLNQILKGDFSKKASIDATEKYQRIFRIKGLRFLTNDIWMEYYKTLRALVVVEGDEYVSYLPRDVLTQALSDGVALLSSKEKFNEYVADFRNHMKNVERFTAVLDYENISKLQVREFLNRISKAFFYYSKTEFFFTDEAFKVSEQGDSETLRENIQGMSKIKNDGRKYINNVFLGGGSHLDKLLIALSKRFGVSVTDLQQYSRKELLSLFDGERVHDEIVENRHIAFYMRGRGDFFDVVVGEKAKKEIGAFKSINKVPIGLTTIEGTSANAGKARGKVRLFVYGYDNYDELSHMISEMKEGEVLVTETTSPELMLACKKAAAIVTDQGGMLSHAAIVSREMNIPCVVNTQEATTLLKTGDLVEVDGDTGKVTIL